LCLTAHVQERSGCRLDQINDAITDMREGRNIRGIIEFD
jgi:Zn-dependent alcohol dehydrogenase